MVLLDERTMGETGDKTVCLCDRKREQERICHEEELHRDRQETRVTFHAEGIIRNEVIVNFAFLHVRGRKVPR